MNFASRRAAMRVAPVAMLAAVAILATSCGSEPLGVEATGEAPGAPGTTSFTPGPIADLDPSEVNGPRAPFADSGPPDVVNAIKNGGLQILLTDAKQAFALPKDPAVRRSYASDSLSSASAGQPIEALDRSLRLLEHTWIEPVALKKQEALLRSLESALNDPRFSGYANYRLEISEWLGVAVEGQRATASFIGVSSYDRNPNELVPEPNGWVSDFEQQFDVNLRHEDGWKLEDESTYRTDGMTGY